jgi:hypothetical protein
LERNKDFENLITIGMRGDGDVAMGTGEDEANIQTLYQVIENQRRIIGDIYNKPPSEIPQVWAMDSALSSDNLALTGFKKHLKNEVFDNIRWIDIPLGVKCDGLHALKGKFIREKLPNNTRNYLKSQILYL